MLYMLPSSGDAGRIVSRGQTGSRLGNRQTISYLIIDSAVGVRWLTKNSRQETRDSPVTRLMGVSLTEEVAREVAYDRQQK